jgi:hypothetical protein
MGIFREDGWEIHMISTTLFGIEVTCAYVNFLGRVGREVWSADEVRCVDVVMLMRRFMGWRGVGIGSLDRREDSVRDGLE